MSATNATRRTPRSTIRNLLLLGLAGAAAAVGAYLDWYLWHPMSGITITLAAAAALIVAVALLATRARLARQLGLGALAIGIGLVAGQTLGPSRPAIIHEDGTMTVHLEGTPAVERTGTASCSTVPAGDQINVSNDANEGRTSETDAFIGVSVSIGDMWDFGDAGARSDNVGILLLIESSIVPEDGKPSGSRLVSDPASTVSVERRGNHGTMRFGNLAAVDDSTGQLTGERAALTGTIEWTCGPIPA